MGGLSKKILAFFVVISLCAAYFTPSLAHAGALNARVKHSSIKVIKNGTDNISLKFDVEVVYNGIGDDTKAIENGTAEASSVGDADNVRWTESGGTKLTYKAKKAHIYKISIPSFKPNQISDNGETTDNDNALWSEYYLVIADWNPDNLLIIAPLGDDPGRPVDKSMASVAMLLKKVGNDYFATPENSGVYRYFLTGGEDLENTVQRALISSMNYSEPYVRLTDPSDSGTGGELDSGTATQLLQNYDFTKIAVEDEANQATTPKPPVIRMVSTTGGGLKNALIFELKEVTLVGGQLGSDNHYFWFQSRTNSNLWVIIDEDGDAVITLASAAGSDTGETLYGTLGGNWFSGNPAANSQELTVEKTSVDNIVMHRIFNECNSAATCSSLEFSTVVDYPNTQTKFDTKNVPWGHQVAVNSNGKNKDAWLDKWGVTYEDRQADGDIGGSCNLFAILGAGDLGQIFSKMVDCLFKSIFRPMIDWATDILQKAAGVSQIPVEDRRYFGHYYA